jgi:hypothetical protein
MVSGLITRGKYVIYTKYIIYISWILDRQLLERFVQELVSIGVLCDSKQYIIHLYEWNISGVQ